MGFQITGKHDFRIGTCTVENTAKLWKASGAVKPGIAATPCSIRAS